MRKVLTSAFRGGGGFEGGLIHVTYQQRTNMTNDAFAAVSQRGHSRFPFRTDK